MLAAGEEIPFELASQSGRGRGAPPLYSYRPLTREFLAERFPSLLDLPSHAAAANLLAQFEGLDRYLLACNAGLGASSPRAPADSALLALLQDVFDEHTSFDLCPERLARSLDRVEGSAVAHPAQVTLLVSLHGLAIAAEELRLTSSLLLAQPHALDGLPTAALGEAEHTGCPHQPLLVVCTAEDPDANAGLERCHQTLAELLRALRLFGDGRIALGPAGHSRIGTGPWGAVVIAGAGGHPHGMLLVTPEQEDELRAFCNLISRRAPSDGVAAWALRRYEFGCEHAREYDSLSDHLLALRALLGAPLNASDASEVPDGLLAGRLAALCATSEQRALLTERTLAAIALERAFVAGAAVEHAGGLELARELANHLRALLRDQICGHLPRDLAGLADELLLSAEGPEQVLGDEPQPLEVLDLAV
jgi:hypothetical protein